MTEPDFWDSRDQAQAAVARLSACRGIIEPFDRVKSRVEDLAVLAELAVEARDSSMIPEAEALWERLAGELDKLELVSFLSGQFDRSNAIVTFHAGSGGTESCDWAEMLFRMYTRWMERHNYDIQVIDRQPGEIAGIKSATVMVSGEYAYGYLRGEGGVHRLVRISPFDSNKRRHTSFAALEVCPEIDDEVEVDLNEKDIKEDTYRSSGAGGQHVNTTDSAVRMTHLPTGIVVYCQAERSQHKNRATCLRILKSKLYERQLAALDEVRQKEVGPKEENAWGSQIRSYVLQPYQMVKDLRTGVETSNTGAVLDGDLDMFIEAQLKTRKSNGS